MEPSEAIETLRKFNAWRRCDDDSLTQPDAALIGQSIDAICDHAERLERELEQERQDRKQADLDTIRALGERNDARGELEQIKAILTNPLAVHLNMMRGKIKWTSANLRHLLGDSQTATEQSHQTKP